MKRISLRFDLGCHCTSRHVCSHWFSICFHCSDLKANNYLTWSNVHSILIQIFTCCTTLAILRLIKFLPSSSELCIYIFIKKKKKEKKEYRSIQYMHHFQVHCPGAEHMREDLLRKSPLELCSYRLCSNHFEELQFTHPDMKISRTPKIDGSSTVDVNSSPFSSRSWWAMHLIWRETVCWFLRKFM